MILSNSMRTGKELLSASKEFAKEDRKRSWLETFITLILIALFLTVSFLNLPLSLRIASSVVCGLLYVRMFTIYHDYEHNAILQNSAVANVIMKTFGVFILAPHNIWKRSHDHHHNHNSKLTISGIGSYPTISKARYLSLTRKEKLLYLVNRHPLTVIFGYLTLFIYWLNIKSFIQSPKKHMDSLLALIVHVIIGVSVYYYLGGLSFFIGFFTPFFLSFAMGSYLFYCQHNFPGATFREHDDWKYDLAALSSTSYMVMNPVMQWFTGNIGYHHVHHINSRIPFYRLKEAMEKMPELQNPSTTSWNPFEVARCFSLKLWDNSTGKMITLEQL